MSALKAILEMGRTAHSSVSYYSKPLVYIYPSYTVLQDVTFKSLTSNIIALASFGYCIIYLNVCDLYKSQHNLDML